MEPGEPAQYLFPWLPLVGVGVRWGHPGTDTSLERGFWRPGTVTALPTSRQCQ